MSDKEESLGQDHQDRHGTVKVVWLPEGPNGSARPWVRPRPLQYFYKDVLYRTEGERSSSRFEIFLDLLFVGMVANLAHIVTEDPTGLNLLKYILVGAPAWQMWGDIRDFMNYYFTDDLTQRTFVFWQMVLIVMFGNNAYLAGTSRLHTGLLVGIYVVSRLSVAVLIYIYTLFAIEHRKVMRSHCGCIIITSCVWFAAIWPSARVQIALACVAIVLENLLYLFNYSTLWRKVLKAEYTTALNLDHEIERYGAFFVIVLGEFLYVIVFNSPATIGFNVRLARCLFVLLIAYNLNWLYFNGDGSHQITHALRRNKTTAFVWLVGHLPLNAALVLAADSAGELASGDYEEEREEEADKLKRAYSFFFAGGIGVGLIAIYILAILNRSHDDRQRKWLPRHFRIIWRAPVALVIIFLPFAKLSSTVLMGIVAAFLTILVTVETLGAWDKDICDDCDLSQPQTVEVVPVNDESHLAI